MTSCAGKARFRTEESARRRLAQILAETMDGPKRAYACAMCLGWHLTSETGAQRRHRDTWRAKRMERDDD